MAVTREEFMGQYGFAAALFESSWELRQILDRAVREQWTPNRFEAAIRNSEWYRVRSAAEREWEVLRTSDPEEAQARVQQATARLDELTGELGLTLNGQARQLIIDGMTKHGWDESVTRDMLSQQLTFIEGGSNQQNFGIVLGPQMDELLTNFGIDMSAQTKHQYFRRLVAGEETVDGFENRLREMAKAKYTGLSAAIDSGLTVRQAADPYLQEYARTLEVNAESVSLDDPLMARALQYRTPDGAVAPGPMPLYEFQEQLRQDQRWWRTNGAKEAASGLLRQIGRDWGLSA